MDTEIRACVKTPSIPEQTLQVKYPCDVKWGRIIHKVCSPVGCDNFNPLSCNVRQECKKIKLGKYPRKIKECTVDWKVFPGIDALERCQKAEAIDVKIGGAGILQYTPEAALFKAIIKGQMYGNQFKTGIECKLPNSGDYEITLDLITRTITSIDNSDESTYEFPVGVSKPEWDHGNALDADKWFVPADVEEEESYEIELKGGDEDKNNQATTTTSEKVTMQLKIPGEDLKVKGSRETNSQKMTKKKNVIKKMMDTTSGPFCEIINDMPSITPPGLAAEAIFNIAPLVGNMAVGVGLGATLGGIELGDFKFVMPSYTFDQTLFVIKSGYEVPVPNPDMNIFPVNNANEIAKIFTEKIKMFNQQSHIHFLRKTSQDYIMPWCRSKEAVRAMSWVGKTIQDFFPMYGGSKKIADVSKYCPT